MFSAEKQARLAEQHRQDVAQLRREASVHRIKVNHFFKLEPQFKQTNEQFCGKNVQK